MLPNKYVSHDASFRDQQLHDRNELQNNSEFTNIVARRIRYYYQVLAGTSRD